MSPLRSTNERRQFHRVAPLVFFALLSLCCASTRSGHRTPSLIVKTDKGDIRGIRYKVSTIDPEVDSYLGIPYAKKPEGHLRFKHPEQVDRWRGIYDATKLPNSCYQNPDNEFKDFSGSTVWNPTTKVSEDCLYLNVWVPVTHPKLHNLAVMVWIYGGGFYSGTSTLNVYDGKIFAAVNNVIVVSINYRLGMLGFLALGHETAPGNAGMFDQKMGLQWVQNNIKRFGGDPNNVTLFGESAGSVCVSLHLLSPLTQDLFQRAIMQSGTANMPWGVLTVDEARKRAVSVAVNTLGCPKTNNLELIAACLRAVSVKELVDNEFNAASGILQFPFLPVVDGVFLLDPPEVSLARGSFKKCPVLLGSNQNEGSPFIAYTLNDLLKLNETRMTRDDFLDSMRRLFFYYPRYNRELNSFGQNAIIFQYTPWAHHPEDKYAHIYALDNAVADCHFVCHVNRFALTYARGGNPVYTYYLTHRYSTNPWPRWMGVLHGDDIFLIFGETLKEEHNFTKDDKDMTRLMMMYWSNFAKTGDPNRSPGLASLNEWPLHTPDGKEYLELNAKFLNDPDKSKRIGRGPRIKECAFWSEYLPQLIANTDRHSTTPAHPFTHPPPTHTPTHPPRCDPLTAAVGSRAALRTVETLLLGAVMLLTPTFLYSQ